MEFFYFIFFFEYNFTAFSAICLLVFLPDKFKAFLVEGLGVSMIPKPKMNRNNVFI